MEARDGWIRQESLVVKALEFLNLAELLRGEKDNPFKRGMDYKSLQAKGELKSGTLAVSEMILHASAMRVASEGKIDFLNRRIDLNVAVSPFKTVDWIVQRIPVVDRILEGTLITLPIRIHGDLQDPKIVPLAPSEVGSRLMGIMKRTLEVPFKFVHPAVKDLEKSRRNPSAGPQKE
jgi:hypothetical protein